MSDEDFETLLDESMRDKEGIILFFVGPFELDKLKTIFSYNIPNIKLTCPPSNFWHDIYSHLIDKGEMSEEQFEHFLAKRCGKKIAYSVIRGSPVLFDRNVNNYKPFRELCTKNGYRPSDFGYVTSPENELRDEMLMEKYELLDDF